MKNKYIAIIIFTLVLLGTVSAFIKKKDNKADITLEVINTCLDNRQCINNENGLKIGNNNKELYNNYYDIKVEKVDKSLVFCINKLWYKEFCEKLWEQQYVEELGQYINQTLFQNINKELNKEEQERLNEYIILEYVKAKENLEFENELLLQNILFISSCKNHELILEMKII